jgi:hypothetical protein
MAKNETTAATAAYTGFVFGGNTKRSQFTPVRVESIGVQQNADGSVTLGEYDADGGFSAFPAESQVRMMANGLKQYGQDGGAGAKTQQEWDEGVGDRVNKVRSGEFGRTRSEREPTDDAKTLALQIAREEVVVQVKAAKKSWRDLSPEQRDRFVSIRFERHEERLMAEAAERIAKRNAVESDDDLMAAIDAL